MNELDVLSDRLHELGERAPVPVMDPLRDIHRGRTALRRRHARSAAGVTALVTMGAAVASISSFGWPGGSIDTVLKPARSASGDSTPTSAPTSAARDLCVITGTKGVGSVGISPVGISPALSRLVHQQLSPGHAPRVAAALTAYRNAAAAILDPSGTHLDSADNKRSGGVQTSSYCDPKTGDHLGSLGTSFGWTSGGGLGVVRTEVVSSRQDAKPQIVLDHSGWTAYGRRLPAGVVSARVTHYTEDGGGHAVVVKRADGLTVAVDVSGRWGNNAAPGSPAATDLPTVDELLTLAASARLTLPELTFFVLASR